MSDDIHYYPVTYIPESVYKSVRDDKTFPVHTFLAEIDTAWTAEALNCVVFNNLHDCPVEGVSLYPKHTDAHQYPQVQDDNGKPIRPPSSEKSLAGGSATDWIDSAPNKNYASVGIWSTMRPTISFYGSDLGLTVQMIKRNSVLQLSIIFTEGEEFKLAAELSHLEDKRKTDDEFYQGCDDHPAKSFRFGDLKKTSYKHNLYTEDTGPDFIVLHNQELRVRLRFTNVYVIRGTLGINSGGGTLLSVFIDEA